MLRLSENRKDSVGKNTSASLFRQVPDSVPKREFEEIIINRDLPIPQWRSRRRQSDETGKPVICLSDISARGMGKPDGA